MAVGVGKELGKYWGREKIGFGVWGAIGGECRVKGDY